MGRLNNASVLALKPQTNLDLLAAMQEPLIKKRNDQTSDADQLLISEPTKGETPPNNSDALSPLAKYILAIHNNDTSNTDTSEIKAQLKEFKDSFQPKFATKTELDSFEKLIEAVMLASKEAGLAIEKKTAVKYIKEAFKDIDTQDGYIDISGEFDDGFITLHPDAVASSTNNKVTLEDPLVKFGQYIVLMHKKISGQEHQTELSQFSTSEIAEYNKYLKEINSIPKKCSQEQLDRISYTIDLVSKTAGVDTETSIAYIKEATDPLNQDLLMGKTDQAENH